MVQPPLYVAFQGEHEYIVSYAEEQWSESNKVNIYGENYLHKACFNEHEDRVKYLVEQGTDYK